MNIFRFNIGGGHDPAHACCYMSKAKETRAEMEDYIEGPNEDYNWQADVSEKYC